MASTSVISFQKRDLVLLFSRHCRNCFPFVLCSCCNLATRTGAVNLWRLTHNYRLPESTNCTNWFVTLIFVCVCVPFKWLAIVIAPSHTAAILIVTADILLFYKQRQSKQNSCICHACQFIFHLVLVWNLSLTLTQNIFWASIVDKWQNGGNNDINSTLQKILSEASGMHDKSHRHVQNFQ